MALHMAFRSSQLVNICMFSGTAVIISTLSIKSGCHAIIHGRAEHNKLNCGLSIIPPRFCKPLRSATTAENLPFGRTRMRAQRLYTFEHCVWPHFKYHGTLVDLQRFKSWHKRRIHSACEQSPGLQNSACFSASM